MPGFHYTSKGSTCDLSSKKKGTKQQFREKKKSIHENIFVFMLVLILFITPQSK